MTAYTSIISNGSLLTANTNNLVATMPAATVDTIDGIQCPFGVLADILIAQGNAGSNISVFFVPAAGTVGAGWAVQNAVPLDANMPLEWTGVLFGNGDKIYVNPGASSTTACVVHVTPKG